MARHLMAINVLLVAVSTLCAAYIVRQLLMPMVMPVARPRAFVPAPLPTTTGPSRPAPGAYGVVVARNVFSPTRSEAASSTMPGDAPVAVRPSLFGVVLREGRSIAYLEDPTTKRVGSYRVGDPIAGGTIESISADNIVIARPEGQMEVRLHDPTRVRAAQLPPALPPGALAPPGPFLPPGQLAPPGQFGRGPSVVPGATFPGVAPGTAATPYPAPAGPLLPNAAVPTAPAPPIPGRRPLLPNQLRRAPTLAPSDAPQQ